MVPPGGEVPPGGPRSDRGAPIPATPSCTDAAPAGEKLVAAPAPAAGQGLDPAAFGNALDQLSELVGRIDTDRRRLADCLERGDLDEARGASQRLGEAVTALTERLGACKELTRGQADRERPA